MTRSTNAKKMPNPTSVYSAGSRADKEDGRHDQEGCDPEHEQVLQRLVTPERSHGHELRDYRGGARRRQRPLG